MMSAQTSIEVKGAAATVRALKVFEPELAKGLNKTIRTAMNQVAAGARANYPKGAWSVRINQKNLLGSVMARGGGARASRFGESAPGIRAAVFEFAGKYQPGKSPQAKGMIESLNARYGSPGRFLWASWDAQKDQVLDTIRQAVVSAEIDLQSALDAAGESY